MRKALSVLLPSALLAGCAGVPLNSAPAPIQIAPGVSLRLPRPADLGRSIEADQLVVARYGSQSVSFEGRIKVADGVLTMIALDPLGRRLASISWTAAGVTASSAPTALNRLDPQHILADLVLLYWPDGVIGQAVLGATVSDSGGVRSVVRNGQEIIRVSYTPANGDHWLASAHYINNAYGYSLQIQSAALQ